MHYTLILCNGRCKPDLGVQLLQLNVVCLQRQVQLLGPWNTTQRRPVAPSAQDGRRQLAMQPKQLAPKR